MGINWSSAYEAGMAEKTAAAAAPAATPAAAAPAVAAPATTTVPSVPSDEATTVESAVSELFAGLAGVSNSLSAFGQSCGCASGSPGDSYIGEVGLPYGSNIIKVDSISGYDFTNTFTNTQSSTITVNVWNKVGHDMQPLSGSALAPKSTTLTFTLAPGASQKSLPLWITRKLDGLNPAPRPLPLELSQLPGVRPTLSPLDQVTMSPPS